MIEYNPQTDTGKGFLPSLIRTTQFVTLIIAAIVYEWPVTVRIARVNLESAVARAKSMYDFRELLSGRATQALDQWHAQAEGLIETLKAAQTKATKDEDAPLTAAHKDALKVFMNQTWALAAFLDQELLGLDTTETDPGRVP